MRELNYTIQFFSRWHCGSGLTAGADLDALVVRDEHRFPYVPGKTIKGLLRESAESLLEMNAEGVSREIIDECFGIPDQSQQGQSLPGLCYFSDAVVSQAMRNYIAGDKKNGPAKLKKLFSSATSTAIDYSSGAAKDNSLRRIEVANPVPLKGTISIPEGGEYSVFFKMCLKMVKRLGTGRNRGLGRCLFEPVQEGGAQ